MHRCSSKVGKHYAEPGKQAISIGDGCNFVGTIIHEMMHALGKNTIKLTIYYCTSEVRNIKYEVKTSQMLDTQQHY